MDTRAQSYAVIYLTCIFVCIGVAQAAEVTEVPSDVIAEVDDDVLLMCNVVFTHNEFDAMEWKEHITKSSGARIFTSAKPTLVSDPNKYSVTGTHNLLIKATTFRDGGQYSCTLYSEGLGHMATVLVMDQPYITSPSLVVGQSSDMSCKIQYGGPTVDKLQTQLQPKLDIYLEKDLLSPTITVTPGILGLSPNIITATINHTATEADNGKTLSCQASTEKPAFQTTATHVMDVRYSVKDIHIMPDKAEYTVGETIACHATGNPTPTFRWRPIKTPGPREVTGSVLSVEPNMVGDNEWRCMATNTLFNTEVIVREVSFTVSAGYRPPVTAKPVHGVGAVDGIHPRTWGLLILPLLRTLYCL